MSPKYSITERVKLEEEALKYNTKAEAPNQNTKADTLKKNKRSKSAAIKYKKQNH